MPASSPALLSMIRPCSRAPRPSAHTCASASPPSPGSRCRRRRRGSRDRCRCRRPRPTAAPPPSRRCAPRPRACAGRALGLGDGCRVILRFAELDQGDVSSRSRSSFIDSRDGALELLALAHHVLRGLRVVPEIRVLGPLFSSARRPRLYPSQRCLRSSDRDSLMSLTSFWFRRACGSS